MKKKLLFVLPILGLLVSCGESSSVVNSSSFASTTSSVTTSTEGESSTTKTSVLDRVDMNTQFYSIDMDYVINYNSNKVATGVETKKVYLGKDSDGFDVKIEFMIGYFNKLSSMDSNGKEESSNYSIYHSPSKTYTLMADSSYKITQEEHDIKPYTCPFDFAKLTVEKEEQDDYDTIITASVADDDVSSFLGSSIKNTADITNLTCNLTFYTSSATLEEASFTYNKGEYSIRQNFAFNTNNSLLQLPE